MKIFIVAGGTGGHVYPALSVAREFKKNSSKVFWVGKKFSLEEKIAKDEEFKFLTLNTSGYQGKNILGKVKAIFELSIALIKALYLLSTLKPDIVFSTGGYMSLPVGFTAYCLRIPLFIHEQNSVPGLSNRILSKLSKITFEGFPNSFRNTNNSIFVGNPLREEIFRQPKEKDKEDTDCEPFNILVLGGSQGSSQLNLLFVEALKAADNSNYWNIVHQTGAKELKTIEATYLDNGTKYKVLEYIENIGQEYQKADLVIARSGAMTVSEIAALGKPSILLPLPWATDNHQYYNAFYLKELGAAEIVESKIDNAKILSKLISDLAQDKERRLQMGHNAKDAFKSSSSIEIYKFINEKI